MSPDRRAVLFLLSEGRTTPPPDPVNWPAVDASCRSLGLGPFLHTRLGDHETLGSVALPAAVRVSFRRQFEANTLLQTRRQATLNRLHGALHRVEVPFIVLKGMALAMFVFPSAAQRPMSDIDILVRRERLPDAVAAMRGEGYSPIPGNPIGWLAPGGQVQVELHGELPSASPRVAIEECWDGHRVCASRGRDWRILGPTHFLHHVALHIGHKKQQGFIAHAGHLIDVDALVRRYAGEIDVARLLSPAAMGAADARLIHIVLTLAKRYLGTPIPNEVLPMAPEPSEAEALALTLLLHSHGAPLVSRINNLLAARSPSEVLARIRVMVTSAFQATAVHQAAPAAAPDGRVPSTVGRLRRQLQVYRWRDFRPSQLRETRSALHARDRLFDLMERD